MKNYDRRYILKPSCNTHETESPFRIGLIVLSTDHGIEQDFLNLLPTKVSVHVTRIDSEKYSEKKTEFLSEASKLILPKTKLNCLAYGCTSGSIYLGDNLIQKAFSNSRPGIPYTSASIAAMAALKYMNIRKIALITPYELSLDQNLVNYFFLHNILTTSIGSFELKTDIEIAELSDQEIEEAAIQIIEKDKNAQGLFIACNALRSSQIIDKVERKIGKPVITSNQALLWHALKKGGYKGEKTCSGLLFST